MEVRMGTFRIHHSNELMLFQHLGRAWQGRKGAVLRGQQASQLSPALPPHPLETTGPGPIAPRSLLSHSGDLPQVMAARKRGQGDSSPIILKVNPADGPDHGEGAGQPCPGPEGREVGFQEARTEDAGGG